MSVRRIAFLSALLLSVAHVPAVRADDASKINACQTISASGSYVLSRNIVAEPKTLSAAGGPSQACLLITADYVTVDLAGFSVIGDSTPDTLGIYARDVNGAVVKNGTVTGFSSAGVNVTGNYETVENVRAIGNGGAGILVFGSVYDNRLGSIVRGNLAANNLKGGINIAFGGGSVSGNVAINNSISGLRVTCPAVVTNNVAYGNAGNEIRLYQPLNSSYELAPPCTAAHNSPELPQQ